MNHRPSPARRFLSSLAILLTIAGAGDAARAQVDVMKAAGPAGARKDREIREAQLNGLIFYNLGVDNAEAARSRCERRLALQVEEMARCVGLGPLPKKKLLLAGRGDIKRFFDRVEEVREKYVSDPNFDLNARLGQIMQEIASLQAEFQGGLFGEGSLFAKTVHATLTPDQARKAGALARERFLDHYWNRIDLGLELLNFEVGFTEDQHARLLELIRSQTTPPRRMAGRYDEYVAIYQLGRIPEEKIRPIFEDYQWPLVARKLQQGRGLGPFLRQRGFEPDESDGPKAPDAEPAMHRQEAKK